MSKADKAVAKVLSGSSDKNLTPADVEYVLARYGFARHGGQGSHRVYRHPVLGIFVFPDHGKTVKPIYIRQLRSLLASA